MADSTHGRVRRVFGGTIGITLAGSEHVMSDEDAFVLVGKIRALAGPEPYELAPASAYERQALLDAATAARAEIVAWLRAERRRYIRDKDFSAAIALMDAAAAIESGAPQRWAAEREAPTQRPEPVSQRSPPPAASPARMRE